jgi:hypothetical protein
MSRAWRWVAVCALSAGAVAGCSQVSALAPVGGDDITTLRIAIDDVLLAARVQVLVAPKCAPVGEGFACKGSTTDGAAIVATSPAGEPRQVSVSVGGKVLFEGEVSAVVDKAAGVAS